MAVPPFLRGDVIFTYDAAGFVHKLITAGQVLGSPSGDGAAMAVHAAIVVDPHVSGVPIVAESVNKGIRTKALKPGEYRVYRYRNADLAAHAAACAEGCVAIRKAGQAGAKYGKYGHVDATLSVFRPKPDGCQPTQSKSLFAHESTTFYCSNFIYRAYASAAEIMGLDQIPIKHGRSQIGPRDLMAAMDSDGDWWFEGRYHQP